MGSVISNPSPSSSIGLLSSTTSGLSPVQTVPLSCPPVPLTTKTLVSVTTVPFYTATTTLTTTVYASTVSTTESFVGTIYRAANIYTSTLTVVATPKVIISQLPFTSTRTIATSSGFTPVRCEATYQQPFPASTTSVSTVTFTDVSTYYISVNRAGTSTYSTNTATAFNTINIPVFAVSYTTSTPTSTSTRTNRVQTVYQACNAANVVKEHPEGGGNLANAFTTDPNAQVAVPAIDQTDCCAICQANSSCIASAYFTKENPPCALFLRAQGSGQCDPRYLGAYISKPKDPGTYVYVSNSGCGQIGPYPIDYV